MDLLGARLPFTQFQEEKYQMLELNQRLESYLGRVKLLEEENKLLREEIHTLKSSRKAQGQRKAQEDALSQARRMLEDAWRKKDHVELEVENLIEDIEVVSIQRQKAKNAQADAQRKLMESRKELEEERRAQIWLREKVGQLEKDLLLQMQVHQDNMETLQANLKQTKQVLMAPHPTQSTSIPDLEQEYSHRAAQAWQEATNNYQRLAGRLEESLNQAKTNMAKIHQEKKENQHQVQHLAKELESTKTKRQMLEKNFVQQREEHKQELHHLQAQVDALELEKDNLGQQIDSLMVDRQNLLQVKMSLGLEVATYRALLDSEGMRIDRPTTKKTSSAFFLDVLSKPTGTQPASQSTAASCHVSNTVSTSHRSITSSRTLLTSVTPTWTPTRGTPQRTPARASVTEKTDVHISEETEKAAETSVDHLQQEKVHEDMALATALPKTAVEPEPQLKPEDIEIQEDEPKHYGEAQMVESKTDASELISVSADQPSNLSQTPELESWAGPFTDPAEVSEEVKDEDTEVSVEMARISHAPKVAWEENKTVAEDEKDDASEMDVRSENFSESHTDAFGDAENDNAIKSSHISVNTNILGSSFLEQGTLDLVGDFGYREDLMKADELDNVSNISEEVTEQMNSETEAAIDSINEWDRQEEIEPENETKVMSPDSEVEEEDELNIDADTRDKTEDVTERKEEIEVIKSSISVQDEGVDSPKNIDHQESLEKTIPPAEPHSDQTVNEDVPLPEESEGEENPSEDDDSPNISASWRTDPGECDSYSQENTLADTRPLIRYKSDEETDGNVRASHLIGETSDSEDEKERMEGGHWNESASKRFNTMEDLTEEPDMEVTGKMMMEDVVSKEDALDGGRACTMLQRDSEVHESLDMVEEESATLELKGSLEEDSEVITEMMTEDVVSKEEALDGDRACTMLQSDSEVHESLDLVEQEIARTDLKENLEEDNAVMTEIKTEDVVSKEESLDGDTACTMLQSDSEVHKSLDLVEQEIARTEFKENLEEDNEVMTEIKTEDVVSKKESLDGDRSCTMLQSDSEVHESLDLVEQEIARTELKENLEEDNAVMTEIKTEDVVSKEESLDGDTACTMLQSDSEVHKCLDLVEKEIERTELKGNFVEDSDVITEMMTEDVAPKDEALDADRACTILQSDSEVHESLDMVQKERARTELKGSPEENTTVMSEMMTEDVASKEEALDGDEECTMPQSDSEDHESLDMVQKESARSELKGSLEEDTNVMTEIMTEDAASKEEALDGDKTCTMLQSDSEVHESLDLVEKEIARTEFKGNFVEDSDVKTGMMEDAAPKDEALDGDREAWKKMFLKIMTEDVSKEALESDSAVNESLDMVQKESATNELKGDLEEDSNVMTGMMTEDVVSKEEAQDGDRVCMMLQTDSEIQESLDMVQNESAKIELKGSLEKNSDVMTQMMTEDVVSKEEAQDSDRLCMMLQSDPEVHESLDLVEKESTRIELEGNFEEDSDVETEMMTEDVVSKEEDRSCMMLQSDSEVHESLVQRESVQSELKESLEEDRNVMTEMRTDEDHDVKVDEQNEQRQLTENQHMHTEQPEDETVHSYESQEHVDIEHPVSFPETSHQLKSSFQIPSTLPMFQDTATIKEPEDLLEVSMHTNVDLTDSQPDNVTSDIPSSDQEEGNSSEDESPNASQFFQSTSLLAAATLNEQPLSFSNGVPKADSVSDANNLPEEVLSKEKNPEEPKAPQIDDWENSNIWGKSMNAPDAAEITQASSMDENAGIFPVNETENLEVLNKMPSLAENIFGKFEEHFERTAESFSEKVLSAMDFQSNISGEEEEFQSKEKKSEIHSFFSTSMKEDFWSEGKMEMAATYDPAKTEDLSQAMVFGEEWRDMEGMPTANGSHKKKMDILKGQDERHKDEQPTQGKMVLYDDSADEGDSWSSGDE
ncbi:Nestin [Labeo rohita]|uniref:Nestin n=1 Tax=Labeo rohita TaxID=84645 RepID=A0ABQ8LX00_LABRO|nr:Nestin [Labeo rohita]